MIVCVCANVSATAIKRCLAERNDLAYVQQQTNACKTCKQCCSTIEKMISETKMQGFPLRRTERDSWSGPEAAGFYVFNTAEARAKYVAAVYRERENVIETPEYYMDYTSEPAIELTKKHKFDYDGKFYADKLFEKTQVV